MSSDFIKNFNYLTLSNFLASIKLLPDEVIILWKINAERKVRSLITYIL